jgi:hypothetical protein
MWNAHDVHEKCVHGKVVTSYMPLVMHTPVVTCTVVP